ncbi:GNAT family N-acetyltransferase [Psychrobacillus sp.]|uniref:GNAT family N-acetyltransferase n=1 Tax=Psychrobacillus sp. TaxID=1871623 RepID=UPI0028BF2247|nr:GNAT family N-acetyltransferase [Psychrobacillus sp.]
MDKSNHVVLDFYKSEYEETLRKFNLPEEQAMFTALPVDKMEEANNTVDQYPIVILSNQIPVGFFILHSSQRVKDYTTNPKALLLTALSINHSQQGKGYAKTGMDKLPEFIREFFLDINEITLVVNKKNIAAQKLYEKVGYRDTGERRIGAIGEQLILTYQL